MFVSVSFQLTWWNTKRSDFGHMLRYIALCKEHTFLPKGPCCSAFRRQWEEAATTAIFPDIVCAGMLAVLMSGRYQFFGFHLPVTHDGNIFHLLFAIWTFTTGEVSVQISCPHFNCVWCLLILEFYEIFVSLGGWSFIRCVLQIFLFPSLYFISLCS